MLMKYLVTLLIVMMGILPNMLFSQNIDLAIKKLESDTRATISKEVGTGTVQFIRFPRNAPLDLPGDDNIQKINSFFSRYGEVFGKKNIARFLELRENKTDRYGFNHLICDVNYKGIPVFGSELRFHFNPEGKLITVNGLFLSDLDLNVNPTLTLTQAASKAIDLIKHQGESHDPTKLYAYGTELFVFKNGIIYNRNGRNHLVYEVEVRDDIHLREYVYIDAHTGKKVEQFTGNGCALDRRLYEGDTNNLTWTEGDPFPGMMDIWQQNQVEVMKHVYHFFDNSFGFTSYDGADAIMRSVNNATSVGCPNATWNGATANFCTGTATDDIIAHEWGHGYTEYTNNLIYAWQTGALNESYSDIWGETVDLFNAYEDAGENLSLRSTCSNSVRWKLGEDATAFGILRDLWDPNCNGDPGRVLDPIYYCGNFDFGGVHINSGVNNKAYALLVDGGTYNGQTVNGIWFIKAAHIFWRAQEFYLTSTSDFVNQADALEAACSDLIGIDLEGFSFTATPAGPSGEIISLADCQELAKVITAVEFRTTPACNFETILAQPAPAVCDVNSGAAVIYNENFESGLGAWTVTQLPVNPGDWDSREWVIDSDLPSGRLGSAAYGPDPIPVGNCSTDFDNGIIRMESPVVTIPGTVTDPVEMSFDHYVAMETRWDGGNIKYSVNGSAWAIIPYEAFTFNAYNDTLNTAGEGNDNPMQDELAFTSADEGTVSGSWGTSVIDLDYLGVAANDDVRLRFELGADGCNGNDGWYIDDLKIYTCMVGLPVELMSFDARLNNNAVALTWKTASEINAKGFEIQKSSNGEEWKEIGWVDAVGESQELVSYGFDDKTPYPGLNYYRLKQIDNDGSFTFTEMKVVELNDERESILVRPNPFGSSIWIRIPDLSVSGSIVELYDAAGRKVLEKNIESGNDDLFLETVELPKGIYWIRITIGEKVFTEKLIKGKE